eukprot:3411810-Rhodomonas_salina.1
MLTLHPAVARDFARQCSPSGTIAPSLRVRSAIVCPVLTRGHGVLPGAAASYQSGPFDTCGPVSEVVRSC